MKFSLRQSDFVSIAVKVAAIVGCFGAIALLQLPELRQLRTRSQDAPIAELRRGLEADRVQLNLLENAPTFGYDNLLADWVFLQFLQYFGDAPVRARTDYRLSPDYFEVILKKDPFFSLAYLFMSNSVSVYAGMPERSIAIQAAGLAHLTPNVPPDSFYIWQRKGIDELLFLGDAAAARQSFLTAAEWAEASRQPMASDDAASFRQTAAFLARNPDSRFAQFSAWGTVLSTAQDDLTRQTAIDRIRALGGDVVQDPGGSFRVVPPSED
jgi:hypothetical protein